MKNSFVDLISLGLVSVILGITAVGYVASKPLVSGLLGLVGIAFGILSLRILEREKLESWFTWFGIVMSVASIVGGPINIYDR